MTTLLDLQRTYLIGNIPVIAKKCETYLRLQDEDILIPAVELTGQNNQQKIRALFWDTACLLQDQSPNIEGTFTQENKETGKQTHGMYRENQSRPLISDFRSGQRNIGNTLTFRTASLEDQNKINQLVVLTLYSPLPPPSNIFYSPLNAHTWTT